MSFVNSEKAKTMEGSAERTAWETIDRLKQENEGLKYILDCGVRVTRNFVQAGREARMGHSASLFFMLDEWERMLDD